MKPLLLTFVTMFLAAVTMPVRGDISMFISPEGSDTNSGTAEQPFATLMRARDAIRELKSNGPLKAPVHVYVADGTYPLTEPLVLGPEDTGTADAPITYEAADGAKPVFTGGRAIRGWKPAADGTWTAKVPDVASGEWYFEQLFVNGKRAVRARTPNKFYFYMQDVKEQALEGGGRQARKAIQTVRMRRDDFDKTLARLDDDELRDVNLMIYHKWDNTRRFVEKVNPESAELITQGRGMKSWNNWHANTRYHLENFLGALDAPGEWFLSRDGTLHYRPRPGEDMESAEVVAPVAEKFLEIQGDPESGQLVEHVTLRGLALKHAQWLTPPGGFEAAQAASPIDAVVMVDGAKNVMLEDCEIAHVGTYVIWLRRGCRNCVIRRCFLHDFGAGGIRIGESGIAGDPASQTSHNVVENNIIRDGGYIFPCAVGVWIGHSPDNKVTHNDIANLFYSGLSVGWKWGYGESLAKRNLLAHNHVHHIGWGVLSDMGGIYTLGQSQGTVVRDNVFHDIYAYSYGGWGLYTDEGSTGILFENNLVYNVKTGGFHQHYGRENIVRNNILAYSLLHQIQATRAEEHLSFTFERNIIYYDTGQLLSGRWTTVRYESGNNCYFNAAGEPITFMGDSLANWQAKGHEQGSMIADPRFADPKNDDFRLAEDSPALKLGFKPFDYTKAGVYGDDSWVEKASEVDYPPVEFAPEPPPLEKQ